MNILLSLIRSHHFLSPAILISESSAVSVLTLILKQPVLLLPLMSTLNMTTVTLSTTILLYKVSNKSHSKFRTVLHALWLKLLNLLISHPSSDLCTGSMNALNKLLSLTYKVLTTSQPDYLHNLISVQSTGRTRSSSLVTLARPSVSSSLQITNRSSR